MQKNDEIILEITDISADGSGIGRYEGMAVFVPLTAIGDTARVKILKVKKTYSYGKLIELLTLSKDRIEPDCPVFSKCGGCVFRHINYSAECRIKENKVKENIKRIGKVDLEPKSIIASKDTYSYRNKAQFPLNHDGKVGFYAFHSHRVIPCGNCLLQPKIFGEIVAVCEKWITNKNISIYDEIAHKGLLRHIYLRIAEITDEIMLTLVINGNSLPFADELVTLLTEIFSQLKSIQLNVNKADTNVILGSECKVLFGKPYITDILCGVKVRLSPLSFYQVNRTMAESLYEKAAEYAECNGKNLLDLYCGAGTIGLSMAKKAKSVIGVEIVPEAIEDAKVNAKENGIKNARFICADATKAAEILAEENISVDVVIVDPPRKGCTEELINIICNKFSPERVVYVSCDSATLARDIAIFNSFGYKLKKYTPVDLFPRTSHIETVALLEKE